MNRLGLSLLAVLGIAWAPGLSLAGAWTQPSGQAYVRFAGAGLDTRSRYDRGGSRVGFQALDGVARPSEYRSREIRLYAEYGVREAVTAYGSFAYKDLRLEQPAVVYQTHGGADVYLGGRFRLQDAPFPVSIATEVKIPTGYSTEDQPSLGGGKMDLTARALVGIPFGPAYTTGDMGFTYRAGSYRNEIVYSAELGSRIAGPLYGRTVVRGTHAVGSVAGDPDQPLFDPSLASPRIMLLDGVLGGDLGGGTSVEVGLSHVLSGRDALAGNTLEVAFVTLWGRDR